MLFEYTKIPIIDLDVYRHARALICLIKLIDGKWKITIFIAQIQIYVRKKKCIHV